MKQDIHNIARVWERAQSRLSESKLPDKKLIQQFIQACELGTHGERGTPVGHHKLCRYLDFLTKWQEWHGNTLTTLTEDQYNALVLSLKANKHRKKNGQPFSDETKQGMLVCLNLFLKFLERKGHKVSFLPKAKLKMKQLDVHSIEKKDWERFALSGKGAIEQATIMFLLDSGARAEEALNVRFADIAMELDKDGKSREVFTVNIRPETSKTLGRKIRVPNATPYLLNWFKIHPDKNDPNAFILPMSYAQLNGTVHRTGQKVFNKTITPHICRHSSATYYANILTEQQLCYRYGWIIGSKVTRRYVNRDQLEGEQAVETEHKQVVFDKLQKDNDELKARLDNMEAQFRSYVKQVSPDLLEKSRDELKVEAKRLSLKVGRTTY